MDVNIQKPLNNNGSGISDEKQERKGENQLEDGKTIHSQLNELAEIIVAQLLKGIE